MVLRYYPAVADSVAPCSHKNEYINLDGVNIETVKSVGLIDRHSKQTEKTGHRHGRPSTHHVTKRKEKGQSSFSTRALEYRTIKDVKPRPLAPKNQVKFLEDEKDACSERQIRRLISPGETSSRRASLPNNLFSSAEEASYWVSNHSPGHGLRLNTFGNDSKGAQLCSDANHTPQQEKKEPKQKSHSGAQALGKSTKRPAESSSIPHKKSRRAKSHNDLEEPGGDDGSGDDKKEEKFACPFYRKDPLRFLECMNVRLLSIPSVKQHLKRRHAANPDPDGSGCQEDLAFSTVSGDHNTEANCVQGNTEDLDIIPPKLLDALKRRSDRRMSFTDQWHEIYELLFGKSDITPKPLLDGVVKEMTSIIRDIWSKDGGQILEKHILTRGMPVSSDQLLSLLPDLLDSVGKLFEDKPVGANADKEIAGTQEPAVKMTTKEICICHQGSVNPFQTPYYMPEMSRYTPISPSASFPRHSSTPIFGVEGDTVDPFLIPHHMPHLPTYNPISASASVTRYSPTPIFELGNSDDPFQNTYQSHLSSYTPISTSTSLTRDSFMSTFDVEISDALRSVGGVFESKAIPYAYPPTTSSAYNFRGMTDSECDPLGAIGRLSMAKVENEARQNCLELQNNYRDNYAGDQELGFGLPSIYR